MVEFQYDAFDRKTGKTVDTGANGSVDEAIVWAWDGQDVVMQFVDSDGDGTTEQFELTNHYLYGDMVDMLLAEEQTNVPGSTDNILWPLADHLGSVRDLVDSSGVIREHRVYNSFGNVVDELDYDASGNAISSSSTSAIDSIFGYTGREWDDDVGLQYNRARWYDPEQGRWISQDPIGFAAGDANLYRYVGNHPSMASDPTGLVEPSDLRGPMWHHLLPREFRRKFFAAGISDINAAQYGWIIDYEYHINQKTGQQLHPGWNDQWRKYFAECEQSGFSPSKSDISAQLNSMKRQWSQILRNGREANVHYNKWTRTIGRLLDTAEAVKRTGRAQQVVITIFDGAKKVGKPLAVVTIVFTLTNDGVLAAAEAAGKDIVFPLDLLAGAVCERVNGVAEEFHRGNNLRKQTKEQLLREILNGGEIPNGPQMGQNGNAGVDSIKRMEIRR